MELPSEQAFDSFLLQLKREDGMYDPATYFAWFVLALLFFVFVGCIVWLGSLPGKIAERRNHPQIEAINALSWFGLLLGGVGWVVAFVWALLRSGSWGHGDTANHPQGEQELVRENEFLKAKIAQLEQQLADLHKKES